MPARHPSVVPLSWNSKALRSLKGLVEGLSRAGEKGCPRAVGVARGRTARMACAVCAVMAVLILLFSSAGVELAAGLERGPFSAGRVAGPDGNGEFVAALGGFGSLPGSVGSACGVKGASSGCEDGAFCDGGVCKQRCKNSADTRDPHNHLCRCSKDDNCFSFNCRQGHCLMEQQMGHSLQLEEELRLWHAALAKEERRDLDAMTCNRRQGDAVSCAVRPARLAVVLAFPLETMAEAELNVMSWSLDAFVPCAEGWPLAQQVDVVAGVAILGKDRERVEKRFSSLFPPNVRSCFRDFIVVDLGLTPEEDQYDKAPPAMFHGALNSSNLAKRGYTHMFWMEGDVFGVRPRWLEALYQLTLSQQAQGAWMVGSMQQHNRGMQGPLDNYHINGNALHAFDSEAYRMFLRRARLNHPNVFDYASQIWRTQKGPMHAHIAQQVTQRFVYTKFIQNHPADVCMETFEDFLARHPATYMVHSKAFRALLLCTECCKWFPGGQWSPWKRENTRYGNQLKCLYYRKHPAGSLGNPAAVRHRLCGPQEMTKVVFPELANTS